MMTIWTLEQLTHDLHPSKQRSELIADGRDKLAIIQPVLRGICVPCKVIRKPEVEKLLLVESGMLGFGIQNSNPESHERLEMEAKFHHQGIQNPLPHGIRRHSADSRIQAFKDRLGFIAL